MPTATVLAAYSRCADDAAATPSPGDLTVGRGGNTRGLRSAIRFDLSGTMPAGSSVTRVRLRLNETVINGDVSSQSWWWGPYNGGTGSTDPSVDSEATRYTRSDVSTNNYGLFTDYRSTGLTSVELGSPAVSHVQSRFNASGSFAIAVRQTPDEGGTPAPEGLNWDPFDGGTPPALLIDYTEPSSGGGGGGGSATEFEEFDGMQQTELMIWNRALSRCGDYRLTFQSAKTVSSATAANPVVCTSTAHGYSDGDLVVIQNFAQMTQVNSRVFRVENPAANTFQLADEDGTSYTSESTGGLARKLGISKAAQSLFYAWPLIRDEVLRSHPWNSVMYRDRLARLQASKTITGATAANPAVITTSTAHGYVAGDTIKIDQVVGMIELNDRYYTVVSAPTTTTIKLNIDSTLYTAYVSGGRTQKALTPLKPDHGYGYKFDLPSDFLRLCEESQTRELWELQGKEVLTDAGITVPIRYVRRLRDTTKWDPLLQSYMAARLAYEICEELTQSSSKKEALGKDLAALEVKAKTVDAQEQSVNPMAEDEWELVRR